MNFLRLNSERSEEERLRALAAHVTNDPESPLLSLEVMRVMTSKSKAENVNAALDRIHTPIIAVFDADHWPEPHCFDYANRIMQHDPKVTTIQGKVRVYLIAPASHLTTLSAPSAMAETTSGPRSSPLNLKLFMG